MQLEKKGIGNRNATKHSDLNLMLISTLVFYETFQPSSNYKFQRTIKSILHQCKLKYRKNIL